MSDLVERHRRACDGFSRVAALVQPDQWELPTPCTEWDARALVEHVIGFHDFLLLRPLGVRANRPRTDPAARWKATRVALFRALDTEGVVDQATELPGGGRSTPRMMLAALTTDVLVHTWDLDGRSVNHPRSTASSALQRSTTAARVGHPARLGHVRRRDPPDRRGCRRHNPADRLLRPRSGLGALTGEADREIVAMGSSCDGRPRFPRS